MFTVVAPPILEADENWSTLRTSLQESSKHTATNNHNQRPATIWNYMEPLHFKAMQKEICQNYFTWQIYDGI